VVIIFDSSQFELRIFETLQIIKQFNFEGKKKLLLTDNIPRHNNSEQLDSERLAK